MEQAKSCNGCSEADDCKIIYEQLGRTDGPPVALKAVTVFVAPVVLFAGTLAIFDSLLRQRVPGPYQTPLAFVGALAVTAGVMLLSRAIARGFHKSR